MIVVCDKSKVVGEIEWIIDIYIYIYIYLILGILAYIDVFRTQIIIPTILLCFIDIINTY